MEEQNADTSLDLTVRNVCHLKLLSNAHLSSITLEAEAGGSPVEARLVYKAIGNETEENFQLKLKTACLSKNQQTVQLSTSEHLSSF